MKILTLDDHALFRAGLRMLLAGMDPGVQVLEAATVAEAQALLERHPDVALCLLDLGLEGEQGLDVLVRLKAAAPDVAAVVVSAANDAATIYACLDAGAMSFVPKSMPPEFLALALKKVLAGEIHLPPEVLHLAPRGAHGANGANGAQLPAALSPRQFDALRGLARGLPTKSIARELGISEYTVKEYIGTLFRALGVHNRTEAVIVATRLGLLSGRPPA